MKAVYVEPRKAAREIVIENDLRSMQSVVRGYIERFGPLNDSAYIICNEDGKITGMPLNRAIYADDLVEGQPHDMCEIMAGPFLICGVDDEGEFSSLSPEQIDKYMKRFEVPERIQFKDGEIEVEEISHDNSRQKPKPDKER